MFVEAHMSYDMPFICCRCFLPAFMSSLLSNVFGVPADQSVVEFSQQASDNLSWTLGSCLFDVWGGVLSVHGANTQRHY